MDDRVAPWTSPLQRLLEAAPRELQPGQVGVVLSGPGVGKTAFLVLAGIGERLAGRQVLHVALGQALDEVDARYGGLFETLAGRLGLDRVRERWAELARGRLIQAWAEHAPTPARLAAALSNTAQHLGFTPQTVLLDGLDWEHPPIGEPEWLSELSRVAAENGARLWLTATALRPVDAEPAALPPPCDRAGPAIHAAVLLEPGMGGVGARLLRAPGVSGPGVGQITLEPDTLLPAEPWDEDGPSPAVGSCCLLSGGARGAESAFGACAERWGLAERTFSFAGRTPERSRGLVLLGPEELAQGDVSWAYLTARMRRNYKRTEEFQNVLRTLWHQVNPAGEVFAVGAIQPDGTVRGGTGWAVELARHLGKPVTVFDQAQGRWFVWRSGAWRPLAAPRVRKPLFAGSGTRSLQPAGHRAIEELFERSFGPPPGPAS